MLLINNIVMQLQVWQGQICGGLMATNWISAKG